jgi:CDP-diacylglycerol--serine O-phosphatidyltransferase
MMFDPHAHRSGKSDSTADADLAEVEHGAGAARSRRAARRARRRELRAQRRSELRGRGIAALLPHLLTTGNLAAGFYAIVKASTGDPERASWAILAAGIFDTLDGRAARLTHSESRFGVEYDSIADTVSFGVAPAVIAFHAGGFLELGWTGWVMAFVFTACASLRLARFNVTSGRYRGRFDGLPSPAAAGMVVSTVWFTGFLRESGITLQVPAVLPAIGIALIGLLMVSPIPYRNGKELRVRRNDGSIVVAVLVFTLLVAKPPVTFFLVAVLYTLSGPFDWLWRQRTGRLLEETAPSDGHADAIAPPGAHPSAAAVSGKEGSS